MDCNKWTEGPSYSRGSMLEMHLHLKITSNLLYLHLLQRFDVLSDSHFRSCYVISNLKRLPTALKGSLSESHRDFPMKTLSPTFTSPAFSTLMFTPKNGADPKTFFSSGSLNEIKIKHPQCRYIRNSTCLLSSFVSNLGTPILSEGFQRLPAAVFITN